MSGSRAERSRSSHAGAALTRREFLALLGGAAVATACGVGAPSVRPSAGLTPAVLSAAPLSIAVEGEPRTLVPSIGGSGAGASEHLFDLVHQSLMTYDDSAVPIPRVARELPSLERGTWRVHADGTMETVWRLREDVRWHDGRPLTSDDVVFSWRVMADPAVPAASRRVARLIDSIETPDRFTAVIRWRARYGFADQLSAFDLTLLPAHILGPAYELRREQIAGHPYWRGEFVGLGPYRVERWPSGSSIELTAFEDYFLGRPVAPEISVRFMPDDNTAMAAVLGGAVDIMLPRRAVHGIVRGVQQRWADGAEGTLSIVPGYSWAFLAPQFLGPQPEDILDVRVRRALAYALDRSAIAEIVAGDRSLASDLWVPLGDPRYRAIAAGVAGHEYNPSRAADLFREAGWRRQGTDDALVKQGRRLEVELTTTTEWERAGAIVAEYWRQAGVVVRETVLSLGAIVDRQARAGYSGVELAGGPPSLALLDGRLHSTNTPSADNHFVGANRGHYASPELDGLLDRLWASADEAERQAAERQIARHVSEELPIIGLFFYPAMAMVRRSVLNTRPPQTVARVGRLSMGWNAHEWKKA